MSRNDFINDKEKINIGIGYINIILALTNSEHFKVFYLFSILNSFELFYTMSYLRAPFPIEVCSWLSVLLGNRFS